MRNVVQLCVCVFNQARSIILNGALLMPRIPQDYLDCVAFLYCSREDAEQSVPRGGTGFLVGRPRETAADLKLYVVTNRHVAQNARVLRFHRLGNRYLVDVDASNWVFHPHGDDVAALCLKVTEPSGVPIVPVHAFITESFIREYGIRPGMEAFMMGRLVGCDGVQQTNPSVRFGNLAMMPDGIRRENGLTQESFLVDLFSLAGHSGSPVFLYETQQNFPGDKELRFYGVRLLGINWGFYRKAEIVWNGTGNDKKDTGMWVDVNTGFACVVPSWKILEVLDEVDLAGSAAVVDVEPSDAAPIPSFES